MQLPYIATIQRRRRFANAGALEIGHVYRTTASQLALRAGASPSEKVLEWMPTNTLVTAAGGDAMNGYQLVTNMTTKTMGWASEQYLAALSDTQPGPPLPAGTYYLTTHDGLGVNLRPVPSTALPALATLPDGTPVHTTGNNQNGFAQVDSPRAGWMASQYLSATPPAGAQFTPANVPQGAPVVIGGTTLPGGANVPIIPPPPGPPPTIEPTREGATSTKAKAGAGVALLLIAITIGFVVARDKKKRKAMSL